MVRAYYKRLTSTDPQVVSPAAKSWAIWEGATVRASAEHDAERPFGLGWAWQNLKQYDNAVNVYTQVTANTATELTT